MPSLTADGLCLHDICRQHGKKDEPVSIYAMVQGYSVGAVAESKKRTVDREIIF